MKKMFTTKMEGVTAKKISQFQVGRKIKRAENFSVEMEQGI